MVNFVIEIVIEIVIKFVMQTLDQINLTIRSTSDSYPLSVCMDMHRSTLGDICVDRRHDRRYA